MSVRIRIYFGEGEFDNEPFNNKELLWEAPYLPRIGEWINFETIFPEFYDLLPESVEGNLGGIDAITHHKDEKGYFVTLFIEVL